MAAPYIVLGPITTNTVDTSGNQWIQGNTPGLGAPAGTLAPIQKPRQAGAWAGDSYAGGRTFVVNGHMVATSAAQAQAALNLLNVSASLAPRMLTYVTSLGSTWMMVRRDGEVIPTWLNESTFMWSVQFFAPDSRRFSALLTGATGLPITAGGLTVPFTVPFPIISTVVSGQINLTNQGNEVGPVRLRVDGPCTGPVITHVGSSAALVFSSSLVLNAGEWLDIDMEAHTVLANGQSSRSGYITSRGWSGFDPGLNTWAFTAASFSAGALLTVFATPADE